MYKQYRIHLLLIVVCLSVLLNGCSQREKGESISTDTKLVIEEVEVDKSEAVNVEVDDGTKVVTEEPQLDTHENIIVEQPEISEKIDVDVDLTQLSSTMVYAEVYNMMVNPEYYMGKTIRIKGIYATEYYDVTDMYYDYILIEDALACCQSGIEITWNNNSNLDTEELPERGTVTQIIGKFESYEEMGQTYYYLEVNELEELK